MGNTCKKKKQISSESRESLIKNPRYSRSDEENYREYFNLIKQKLRMFYEENQNNQFNISLSLDKKDFNTVTTAKKITINPSQKFVYWKDFLLNYLQKQVNKGNIWANELIDLVKAEIFLSENKWLSLFFWQEFEMRTKPRCLNNLVRNSEKDRSIESGTTDNYMHSITDRLNGSFVSINTDSLSINDPTHEYKEYRNKVKAYINIFKEHVFDNDHPINLVSKYFINTFSAYILEKMKDLHSLRSTNPSEFHKTATITTGELTKALQKFILKLQTALRLMYSKTINYQCFIEEKDEFINLITNLIFRDGKLYKDFYELFKVSMFDQIKVLEGKFSELKNLKPEDLGIHEKFCLNTTTLNFQKKLLEENKTNLNLQNRKNSGSSDNSGSNTRVVVEEETTGNKREDLLKKVDEQIKDKISTENDRDSFGVINYNNYDEYTPHSNATMKLNIRESIAEHDKLSQDDLEDIKLEVNKTPIKIYSETDIMKKSLRKPSAKRTDKITKDYIAYKYNQSQSCYEPAIKLLRSISKYRVPFEKMMLIATISSEITECVNTFWKDFEKIITSSLLNIDADELMTIFIYIIIKSQMPELLIHSKFIKEFTTSTTRSTMMGYYYTTLEASLIYILSISDKADLMDRDKMRQSLVPNKTSFIGDVADGEYTMLAINNFSNSNNKTIEG